jgi:hypothetical protein
MRSMKFTINRTIAILVATCFASTNVMAQTRDAKSSQSPEYELALQRGTQAVIRLALFLEQHFPSPHPSDVYQESGRLPGTPSNLSHTCFSS